MTACALAHAGFGRTLLAGIQGHSKDTIPGFLDGWRESIRDELKTNASGYSHSLHAALANNIPSDFPDMDIVSLYVDPVTSEGSPTAPTEIVHKQPQLAALATFAQRNFVWGTTNRILERFSTSIFPGLALRQVLDAATSADLGHPIRSCSMLGTVVGERENLSTCFLPEVRVLILVSDDLLQQILSGTGTNWSVGTARMKEKIRAWLPRELVEHVLPALLETFAASKAKKKGTLFLSNLSPYFTDFVCLSFLPRFLRGFNKCSWQEASAISRLEFR